MLGGLRTTTSKHNTQSPFACFILSVALLLMQVHQLVIFIPNGRMPKLGTSKGTELPSHFSFLLLFRYNYKVCACDNWVNISACSTSSAPSMVRGYAVKSDVVYGSTKKKVTWRLEIFHVLLCTLSVCLSCISQWIILIFHPWHRNRNMKCMARYYTQWH